MEETRITARRAAEEPTHVCDRCGERMYESHCKIFCPNCGFLRDCSDP